MRVSWVLLLITGCVTPMRTIDTFPTQRMALSTLPTAPLAVAGSPGFSLAARILTGAPQPQAVGGAVSFPSVQPEVGGLLQLGDRTWLGGRLNFVMGSFGMKGPSSGAHVPESEVAFDVGVGAGHDLRVQPNWGFTFSGEVGFSGSSLTSSSTFGIATTTLFTPSGRVALGAYGNPAPSVRLFLAGSIATSVSNDATSTITRDCFTTCTVTDSGSFDTTPVGMVGGGARWQVNPTFSLALEVWVPFTSAGTWVPPMISLTARAGDFVVRPRPPKPLTPPPPPPPEVEPEQVEAFPQL